MYTGARASVCVCTYILVVFFTSSERGRHRTTGARRGCPDLSSRDDARRRVQISKNPLRLLRTNVYTYIFIHIRKVCTVRKTFTPYSRSFLIALNPYIIMRKGTRLSGDRAYNNNLLYETYQFFTLYVRMYYIYLIIVLYYYLLFYSYYS